MKTKEDQLHWADEKEVVKTNRPILLLFKLLKLLPSPLALSIIYPVGFFYTAFSKRARQECRNYQKTLKEYTNGQSPVKISPYRQVVSFCLCVMEKIEGWIGKFIYENVIIHEDDYRNLVEHVDGGKGAVLIGSHLGNIELLRSLYNFGKNGLKREVPVTVIMEQKATEQFNQTMKQINPDFSLNVIDPSNISPDTIITLQEKIENGEIIVFTGDRTSARSRTRTIRKNFLGRPADFPYGVFLLTALLNAPAWYMFGLRTKTSTLHPQYNLFVEKSEIKFDCNRSERERRIVQLCEEYISKLEKYCIQFPYQFYNFYNFWKLQDETKEQEN